MVLVQAVHRVRAALVAAVLLGLLVTAASPVHAERLPMRRYTTTDGLPHDRVTCIVQDSHAFLWFCTAGGLSRFDGSSFTTYTERHGLPSNVVLQLLEAADGDYWVATSGGLCRFTAAASRCEVRRLGDDLARNRARVLYRDRSGTLWAGTGGDLFRLDATARSPHVERVAFVSTRAMNRSVHALAEDAVGSFWVATGVAVWQRVADGRFRRRTFGADASADGAEALSTDRDGRLWIAHRSGLIVLKPSSSTDAFVLHDVPASGTIRLPTMPGEAIRFVEILGASSRGVSALYQSPDGPMWIATRESGLLRFEDGRFRRLPAPRGLSIVTAIVLTGDRDGNVWAGTVSDGALKIAREAFVTYDESEGLPLDRIVSIFEDRGGAPVVVTADGLTHRFDGRRFTSVRPNLPVNFVANLLESGQVALQAMTGDWWFRTPDALFRFAVRRFEDLEHTVPQGKYTTRDGLLYGDTSRMRVFADSRGDIWIAAWKGPAGGLTRWDHVTRTFQRCSLPPSLVTTPTVLEEDHAGHVWVGFAEGGLARCRPEGCEAIDLGAMRPAPVSGFYVEDNGRLWFAAERAGLGRIDDPAARRPAIVVYSAAQGLAGSVTSVTGDRLGRVYAGTASGVDRLDPVTGHVKHFTAADGLAQNEQRIAFRDRRGTLWFGTERGLSRLVPAPDAPSEPPPIRISGVRIAGVLRPLSALGEIAVEHVELAPERNQLQIDFASIGFASGDVPRYQYQLIGADADWSSPAPERTVTYAKLTPGAYRFVVRAINADGLSSPQPAAVAFHVLAPFWRLWWFLSLSGAVVGLAFVGLHRNRVRRLVELERVRTRIASDLHDDIGSTLSQIAILGEVVQACMDRGDGDVREPLSHISDLSRESVSAMSDIVWAIDPHRDRLANLTQRMRRFASDLLPARGIEFRFTAGEEDIAVGPDVRRQVFLIFKEALSNAVRHSRCAAIEIDMRIDGASLVLGVSDDGQGFDANGVSDGHGLASLQQRARTLGGTLDVVSDRGTSVTLRILHRRPR
jgi:signal transduction histidine kinase/ligand-binding sensor domain-containing protein